MLELFIVVFDYVWFVHGLLRSSRAALCSGSPSRGGLPAAPEPTVAIPVRPLHMPLPFAGRLPLTINFFGSFCSVLSAKFLKLGCAWARQCCRSRHGPCSRGTCGPLGKTDVHQVITSWMPSGCWDGSSRRRAGPVTGFEHCQQRCPVELCGIADMWSFLTYRRGAV